MSLPPQIANFFSIRAEQVGKQINETCKHWVDDEILASIKHEDPRKQEELRERYEKTRHSPIVTYWPDRDILIVKCMCNDFSGSENCNRNFPKIAEVLHKELKELQ